MQSFALTFGIAMVAIGVFLAVFYGWYMKRRDVGRGLETPEKRMALYGAIGISALFVGVGLVFLFLLA